MHQFFGLNNRIRLTVIWSILLIQIQINKVWYWPSLAFQLRLACWLRVYFASQEIIPCAHARAFFYSNNTFIEANLFTVYLLSNSISHKWLHSNILQAWLGPNPPILYARHVTTEHARKYFWFQGININLRATVFLPQIKHYHLFHAQLCRIFIILCHTSRVKGSSVK